MSHTQDRTQSTFQRGQQANHSANQVDDTVKAVATLFDQQAGRYERLLPSHISVDDFRNAFLTSVQRNPKLLSADRSTFWLALQQAAADGLKCDNREAALVIFSDDQDEDGNERAVQKSGKPKQVVYMPMVSGLRKLIRNTGLVSTIETELIFKGETVELWREDGKRHFKHVTNTSFDANRSDANIVGAYAVVNYKDGTWQVEWMSRAEIDKVRAVSRAKNARSPWQAWYSEMARKTALRRLIKQLDKSPEVAALDKALEADPTLVETIEGEATEIAEGIAARPTEVRRQQPSDQEMAASANRQAQQNREPQNRTPDEPYARQRSGTPNDTPTNAQTTTAAQDQKPMGGKSDNLPQQDDGGFEAWVVDADGIETTVDLYTDPMKWAVALTTLCAGKSNAMVDAILDNNEGAIAEAKEASPQAAAIIDSIRHAPGGADLGGKEDGTPSVTILAVPTTPKGAPHWPNYIAAVKERLDACYSPDEAEAWMAAQKPSYVGKCPIVTENQIQRLYDQTLDRLVNAPEVESDADRALADRFLVEIDNATDAATLRALPGRKDVKDALARWEETNFPLFAEVRDIAKQRLAELEKEGGQ